MRRAVCALAIVCLTATACDVGRRPTGAWNITDAFVAELQSMAARLAEREMVAMQVAELAYKGEVATYPFAHPIYAEATHNMKWYRQYTGYSLVDIYRSDSLLEPIIIEIEYTFDYLRTPIRSSFHYPGPTGRTKAKRAAAKDSEFTTEGTQLTLRRRYQTDAHGNVISEFPPLASHLEHPEFADTMVVEGYSPRDQPTATQPTAGLVTQEFLQTPPTR